MADKNTQPNQDPAEGSRETIEHNLQQQEKKGNGGTSQGKPEQPKP